MPEPIRRVRLAIAARTTSGALIEKSGRWVPADAEEVQADRVASSASATTSRMASAWGSGSPSAERDVAEGVETEGRPAGDPSGGSRGSTAAIIGQWLGSAVLVLLLALATGRARGTQATAAHGPPGPAAQPADPAATRAETRSRCTCAAVRAPRWPARPLRLTATGSEHWVDADHDRQDTREEVLVRVAGAGRRLHDHDRRVVLLVRRRDWTDPSDVDIDHLVPPQGGLGPGRAGGTTAPGSGSPTTWTTSTLVAVTDNVNQSKGDRDVAECCPTTTGPLRASWVAVKLGSGSVDRHRSGRPPALPGPRSTSSPSHRRNMEWGP